MTQVNTKKKAHRKKREIIVVRFFQWCFFWFVSEPSDHALNEPIEKEDANDKKNAPLKTEGKKKRRCCKVLEMILLIKWLIRTDFDQFYRTFLYDILFRLVLSRLNEWKRTGFIRMGREKKYTIESAIRSDAAQR